MSITMPADVWQAASQPNVTILAHGLGGRTDLPVPAWIAIVAGTSAVLISAIVLGALWTEPRLRGAAAGVALPAAVDRVVDSVWTRRALQAIGVVLFAVFLVTALVGSDSPSVNPAPTWFYVWFWVGLVAVSLVAGPIYRLTNPLRTIGTLLHPVIGRGRGNAAVLERLAYYPAVVGLAVFLWMELVVPGHELSSSVAAFVIIYAVINVAGGAWFGPRWFDRCDGFEAYFSLAARLSPFGRRGDGRLVFRSPLDSLLTCPDEKGITTVILVVLGSTAFDGTSRLQAFKSLDQTVVRNFGTTVDLAFGTLSFVFIVAAIAALYIGCILASRLFLRPKLPVRNPFVLFAHSLIPIMVGYSFAHYFSFFLFQGQAGYTLVSGGQINYALIAPKTIAAVQILAIVIGHIVAVVSGHDRAVQVLRPGFVKIGQLPVTALMISYTMFGIMLVSSS